MTAPPPEPTVRHLVQAALALQGDPAPGHALGLWRSLAPALTSIIGARGFDTLFLRSMWLAQREHPWLRLNGPATAESDVFTALEQSLAAQDASEALQASLTLFIVFFDILASLIGEALTKHLMRTAWSAKTAGILENKFNDE